MRLLTFNVNSLQRLLNHPLHHILKKNAPASHSINHEGYSAAAESNSVGATASAVPALLRTQAQIDAHEASIAADARERATLMGSVSNMTPSTRVSSAQLKGLLDGLHADIICFQEVKMARSKLPAAWAMVDGYDAFFSFSRKRQGYSGTATFCRKANIPPTTPHTISIDTLTKGAATPLRAEDGFTGALLPAEQRDPYASAISDPSVSSVSSVNDSIGQFSDLFADFDESTLREVDSEGRCVVTDHGEFVLFNVYVPALTDSENVVRLEFKETFARALQMRCESLIRSGRHVIIVGDLNAAAARIDHADFSSHEKKRKPKAWKQTGTNNSTPNNNEIEGERKEVGEGDTDTSFEANRTRSWLHGLLVEGGGMVSDI
jgi:exonuclease III